MSQKKIVIIGGGSLQWAPRLALDLFMTEALNGSRLVLVDIDQDALQLIKPYCQMLADQVKADWTIETSELDAALDGADGVCVCISTGGYEAMNHDYTIPEKYGVYHTVGDTVGPGGISRVLRNVPIFVDIAQRMEKYCPDTWMTHVTNPLAQLTRCVERATSIRALGLCHNYIGTRAFLANFFQCQRNEIHATSVGVNHFTWLKDITCRGKDVTDQLTMQNYLAYEARKKGKPEPTGTTEDAVAAATGEDEVPRYLLNFKLHERFGYFPVGAASHVAENFPYYINSPETIQKHGIKRKGVLPQRADAKKKVRKTIEDRVSGREPLPEPEESAEALSSIMAALCMGEPTQTVMNLPNRGQISNLPRGAVVETWGIAGRGGAEPVYAGDVPAPVRGLVQTIVDEEELAVEAALTGDRNKVVQAIQLSPAMPEKDRAADLADELLEATAQWLPQFQGKGKAMVGAGS